MKLRVNGHEEDHDVRTVQELLEALGIDVDGVAVAVNRSVVPRTQLPQHPLSEGDEVEVVRAVGGG